MFEIFKKTAKPKTIRIVDLPRERQDELNVIVAERVRHMNAQTEALGLELPDPRHLFPETLEEGLALPADVKIALKCEFDAITYANACYQYDLARRPEWVQDPLPLPEFDFTGLVADSGWCAPSPEEFNGTVSEPTYVLDLPSIR